MTLIALLLALGQINPCGNAANCVLVGNNDGGQVQLSGVVTTSKGTILTGDGGTGPAVATYTADVKPSQPATTLRVQGNEPRSSTAADLVLGGTQNRDGGQTIISIVSGGQVIATFSSTGTAGTLTVANVAGSTSTSGSLGKFDLVDAGAANVVANLGVGGNATVVGTASAATGKFDTLDAGVLNVVANASIGGKLSATSNSGSCNLDGGSPSQCDATVTSGATCVCGAAGTTAAAAVSVAANVSSTTLTCTAANTLTSAVNYWCNK